MSHSPPPTQKRFDDGEYPDRAWVEWALAVHRHLKYQESGTTAERPLNGLTDGDYYMDTTLGKPIWYLSSGWVDATGATV